MSYAHRLEGRKVDLDHISPSESGGMSRTEGEKRTAALGAEMAELLDLLFEANHHALLIVLQGRDTSGKDGTIRSLLTYTNAQSFRVVPFKVPSAEELSHDFLWRIHAQTPARGSIALFNRSHYEDVLIAKVHQLASPAILERRYDHINHFESLLLDSNVILLKFCLHISKEEQEKRLLAREQDTEKAWKLSVGDWQEREHWDEYTRAYETALTRCASPEAPWHLVSANHKWFRNLAVTETVVEKLRPYKKEWLQHLTKIGAAAEEQIAAYRQQHRQKDG